MSLRYLYIYKVEQKNSPVNQLIAKQQNINLSKHMTESKKTRTQKYADTTNQLFQIITDLQMLPAIPSN